MDVRLPDGTVIRNVPDGMSQADLTEKLALNGYDTSKLSAPPKPSAEADTIAGLVSGKYGEPKPLSRMDKFIKGVRDPIDGGAQLLTNMLPEGLVKGGDRFNNWLADKTGMVARVPEGGVDQMVREREQQYQARRAAQGDEGFDGYRTMGNVVSPANLALAARAPAAASLAGRMGVGAATGAASGMLSPVTGAPDEFWADKGKQMGIGAAAGGAMPAVTGGLSRMISPNASRNAELQLLKREGVRPTVGQQLGGAWNAAEEKMQSLPLMGDAISWARRSAVKDFNKAAINRAGAPVGSRAQSAGHEGVREAGDQISDAYQKALSGISGVHLDQNFGQSLTQLQSMAGGLTTEMEKKFTRTLSEVVMRKVSQAGSILPDDYKAIDSELGNLASRFGKSQVASEQELGDAVQQLQALLKQQMMRSNPGVAQKLQAADEAWANLVRVEGAAKTGMNNSGLFTPGQLNTAIRAADDSVRKRSVSRGTALMQDLGNAGQSVLGNRIPDSGTAGRLLMGGGAVGAGLVNPMIPMGLAGGAGLYTPQMQRLLGAAISSRPAGAQQAADAFRNASPMLIPGGAQLGLGLFDY